MAGHQRRRLLTALVRTLLPVTAKVLAVESFRRKFQQKLWILITKLPKVLSLYTFSFLTLEAFVAVHRPGIKKQGLVLVKDSLENTET